MQREHLGSRLGFILLSAGCAIGIGNVWKFPWMAGQYGGGIFVVAYLIFLVLLGVPTLTMEFAMGRAAQKSPLKMYQQLQPNGRWNWHGYVCLLGNVLLMMYYTTVSGWMLQYFVDTAGGKFVGLTTPEIEAMFPAMLANPGQMALYMGIVVVSGFLIISLGVQKGLERVTKYMMLALIVMMLILAGNSIFLEGGEAGLAFYLIPDLQRAGEIGIGNVIVGAMNQSFFTLSLGIGAMAIFGSYIGKDHALMGESVRVCVLDTFVALCAGLIIFPACFAYNGGETGQGPSLIFVTLPNVFNNMPFGRVWGALFFIFLFFAAVSTVIAVFENILAFCMDKWGWSRRKAAGVNLVGILVLSMPCILGYSVWADVHPLGMDISSLEDFIVSNNLLPLGSLLYVLFCTRRSGWGWDNFLAEANTGDGIRFPKWVRPYITWVLPLIILFILVMGYWNTFFA